MDNTNNLEFKSGDIIVNEDFSVIGAFEEELFYKDSDESFPTFFVACNYGRVITNFDDLESNWPGDYRLATDDEISLFLEEVEDIEGLVWNPQKKSLDHRDGSWRLSNHVYPKTWVEATENYPECSDLEANLVVCSGTYEFEWRVYTFAQVILLYDIYREGNDNVPGEMSYAITVTDTGALDIVPFIYGRRNTVLSFRYQEQAKQFLTYFEDMIKLCSDLI